MTDEGAQRAMPAPAKWLGLSGLIPFIGCALIGTLASEPLRSFALNLLLAYGAIILSFLGGVHWGLLVATGAPKLTQKQLAARFLLSVIPSLIGWAALFINGRVGFLVLSLALALVLIVDRMSIRDGFAPHWFMRLRRILSTGAIASLLIGFMG